MGAEAKTGRNTPGLVATHPQQSLEKHHHIQHPRGKPLPSPAQQDLPTSCLRNWVFSFSTHVPQGGPASTGRWAAGSCPQPLSSGLWVRLQPARSSSVHAAVQVCSAHAKEQQSKQPCLVLTGAARGLPHREPPGSSFLSPNTGNIFFPALQAHHR